MYLRTIILHGKLWLMHVQYVVYNDMSVAMYIICNCLQKTNHSMKKFSVQVAHMVTAARIKLNEATVSERAAVQSTTSLHLMSRIELTCVELVWL